MTFLCTFTIFHMEVHEANQKRLRFWWMLVAIFIPEMVMLRALRQYIEAQELTQMMLLHTPWSVSHSFMAHQHGRD